MSLLIAVFLGNHSLAQDSIPQKLLENYKFRSIGPAGMSGRITAIKVDPRDKQVIYAGSASGGLWRSRNGGISWQSIFDHENVSSVGALALDPQNPDVIWVGTGEGNPRNSLTSGYGIYKSLDGGKSWQSMGLELTRNIHRILVNPYNPDVVYVAAIGTPWGKSQHRGVYKTTDGGKIWKQILYVNEETGAAEMVMDPQNPNKLMVAMWEHSRKPWFFHSGGPGSGLYVTFDGGESWKKRGEDDGLPKGELGRLGLAIAPSDPQRVYALVEHKGNNALYISEDGGFKWKKVSEDENIGNRPFYYAEIYVDPQNENRIYSLWSVLTMSEDAGKTWTTIAPYSEVHPDHHAFFVHPDDPHYIIEGNDGGLNISRDRGKTWRFVENLPVAQFYHINYDMEMPYNVYGGMQDNGSWKGPAYVWRKGGIRNSYWQELYFGDGFDVVPDPSNPRFVYAMSQEGYVGRVDTKTGYSKLIRPVHPEGKTLRFNWNAAIAQDPFDSNTIYFGAQYLFKSENEGENWKLISDDLTTNDTAKQKFTESGGLTYDVTGAENYTTILAIEPDKKEKGVLWAGTDDGNVQITRDGGESWTNVASRLKNAPPGMWVPQIVASSHKAGAAFVVLNDYRRNNWKPYLYYTEDYGKTFRSLVSESAVPGYTMSVVQDPKNRDLLFLGTQRGLYFSWDFGVHWQKWGDDFPTVPVADLKIHPREDDLIVGTFGRAAYILDDLAPLRMLIKEKGEMLSETKLAVAPIEDAYQVQYMQAFGSRFAADAMYKGENREFGAYIYYWNGVEEKDSVKVKKAAIRIFDEEGDQVRVLKKEYSKGLNRVVWGLDAKSVKFPGRKDTENDSLETGGLSVMPGLYKVRVELGPYRDSAMVEVKPNPRIEIGAAAIDANYQYKKQLYKKVEVLAHAAKQIRRSEKTIELIRQLIKAEDKDSVKELTDSIKSIEKKLEKFAQQLYGREVEGYFSQPDILGEQYNLLNYYLFSNLGEVTEGNQVLVDKFLEHASEFLTELNQFYETDWQRFREFVHARELSLFEEPQSFSLPGE